MDDLPRIVGTSPVSVERGDYGTPPRAFIYVDRRLKSGKLDRVELSESDLLRVLESGVKALRILGGH